MPSSRAWARQRARASAYSWLSTPGPSSACSKSDWPKCASSTSACSRLNATTSARVRGPSPGAGREVAAQPAAQLGQHHQQLVLLRQVGHRVEVGVVDDRRALGGQQLHRPLGVLVGVACCSPRSPCGARRSACRRAGPRRRATRSRCRRRRARRAARPRRARSSPSGRGSPGRPRSAPPRRWAPAPTVGLNPTQPLNAAGQVIEPSVSVPTANGAMPAADRGAAAGARTAGGPVQGVGVAGQAAVGAPPGGRVLVADVGPLAEVRLAEHDHPGVAQPAAPARASRDGVRHAGERQRPGGRGQVGGVDVVLHQHRAARAAARAAVGPRRPARRACSSAAVVAGAHRRDPTRPPRPCGPAPARPARRSSPSPADLATHPD